MAIIRRFQLQERQYTAFQEKSRLFCSHIQEFIASYYGIMNLQSIFPYISSKFKHQSVQSHNLCGCPVHLSDLINNARHLYTRLRAVGIKPKSHVVSQGANKRQYKKSRLSLKNFCCTACGTQSENEQRHVCATKRQNGGRIVFPSPPPPAP